MVREIAGESQRNPEEANGKVVAVDPRELRRGNLAFKIVNFNVLDDGIFKPRRYDGQRAEVVKVQERDGEIVYKVRDGHHRVAAAADYMETTDPDYEFYANDVTDFYTKEDREFLAKTEWLKIVSDPTLIHVDHAFRRIAAIIMTDWKAMVGEPVEKEVSALGGLALLDRSEFQVRSNEKENAERNITKQRDTLLFDSDIQKKDAFAKGLSEMAALIIDTGLGYDEIAGAAFEMVTSMHEDIGAEEREKQIRGLLMLPQLKVKLLSSGGDVAAHQETLFDSLTAAFGSFTTKDLTTKEGKEKYAKDRKDLRSIHRALMDEGISRKQLMDILSPESADGEKSFAERYERAKWEVKFEKTLELVYNEESSDPPPYLEDIIKNTLKLNSREDRLVREAMQVSLLLIQADQFMLKLEKQEPTRESTRLLQMLSQTKRQALGQGSLKGLKMSKADLIKALSEAEKSSTSPETELVSFKNSDQVVQDPGKVTVELETQEVLTPTEQIKHTAALLGELLADNAGVELNSEVLDALDVLRAEIDLALIEGGKTIAGKVETVPSVVFVKDTPLPEQQEPDQINIPWEEVTYGPDDGTLRWFQEENYDSRKATKMLHDRAKEVATKDPQVSENWDKILSALTYKNAQGEDVHGLDAFEQALVQETVEDQTTDKNVVQLIRSLGLTKESPEVAYLATHFMLHSLLLNRDASVKPLKPLLQPIMTTISSFQGHRNNKSQLQNGKGEILQHLCYADLTAPESHALIAKLLENPFDANTSRNTLHTARQSHGQVPTLFKKHILKE